MKKITILLVGLLFVTIANAQNKEDVVVKPNQLVVQVKGIVCSFCAYGAEKNLAKLKFLNTSLFGDGVMLDIHANQAILALKSKEKIDLKEIIDAIKIGGYDPIKIYFRLEGSLFYKGKNLFLRQQNEQIFQLEGKWIAALQSKQYASLQAFILAPKAEKIRSSDVITVTVSKIEKEQ